MKDLIGSTLGQYRIEALLGFGGMGQVFRGKHVYLDRLAAVKVMHEHLASNPTFRARFLQEARATVALKNPYIVEIYEFGEQDGLLYLVMELLTDGTLSTLLQPAPGRDFDPGARLLVGLDLIRQAAEGLDAAHALGMIHRDIKPDNLLLRRLSGSDRGGGQYQLKISDFGLARVSESSGLTTGGPVGTPAYMSPEQCLNEVLDGRSDLYSLGVVLYEVLTGRLPFQINSFSDAVQKHVNDVPPPLQQIRPDLPPFVEQIVGHCLTKRREDRYQTGKELAEALQGAINHAALETRAPLVLPAATPVAAPAGAQTPRLLLQDVTPVADRTTHKQAQGTASTKKRRVPNWFFPGLAALLAVVLILVIVIPRGGNPSGVGASATPTPVVTRTTPPNSDPAQLYNTVTSRSPSYSSALQQDDVNWDHNNQCHFGNGGYHVSEPPGGADFGVAVCFEGLYSNVSDFAFQAQMTINSGSNETGGGGLVFRGTNGNNCYRWRVGPDGSYDVFRTNLTGPAGSATSGPVLNHTILLTVIAQGNLIYLYVNNHFISSVSSTFSNQGQVGFLAFAKDQSIDITFTNAQLWQL